ncbi:unnamed protein product [Paramecium sonneborni]|uniref:C3H1-type domain-containing protein n=1 Tax=Paramecium sonneborni TaxID=65129 RepID=A0A8S1QEI9_9CILI|nr:unnamed protein product [Paramecium sonneborni]
MNATSEIPCKYFSKNACSKGDQCRFLHDPSLIQNINLEENSDEKQQNKKNYGFENYKKPIYNQKEQTFEDQDSKSDKISKKDSKFKLNLKKKNDNFQYNNQMKQNERSQIHNNEKQSQNDFRDSKQKQKNNVNSDRWERNQENDEDKQDFKNNYTRGRGNLQFQDYRNDQVNFRRGFNRQEQRGFQNYDARKDDFQDEEHMQNIQKRIKKNVVVAKKILKLEQSIEIYEIVKIIGFYNQQLIILKANQIEFYNIPFKRNGTDILDDSLKTSLDHWDKILLNGWIQEQSDGRFNLIVEFIRKSEKIKNLLIYPILFQQESHILINEVTIKNIVFAEKEQDLILTFCQDGLIRIFQYCEDQYKFMQHYNLDQTIETVIKVGSNYLIGTRKQKIFIFDGLEIQSIQYQFDKICTQMVIDFNRVILKFDNETESSIYILTQNLKVNGPMYNGSKIDCLDIIRSYENEKLFIFSIENSVETFIEIDNKLQIFDKLQNQNIKNIQKFEMKNQNMLIQKYIVGNNNLNLKLYSIIPEE